MPVLSVQITVTEPKVSMALRRRVITPSFAILCTPMAKTILRMAGNPSGMTATAKLMAARKSSKVDRLWRSRPTPRSSSARPKTNTASPLLKRRICRSSGVGVGAISSMRRWILPISLRSPVAVTTPTTRPLCKKVPAKSMFRLSARIVSPVGMSVDLSRGRDSPVSRDSSARAS